MEHGRLPGELEAEHEPRGVAHQAEPMCRAAHRLLLSIARVPGLLKTCAPTATRTRDLPLRRSSYGRSPSAALLVRGGLLVVCVPLDVCGFCLVRARERARHASRPETVSPCLVPGRSPTAAMLVGTGFVVVLVLVNVPGFRLVLARMWRGRAGSSRSVFRRSRCPFAEAV